MSTNEETENPPLLTDQQRIALTDQQRISSLEGRVAELEEQMFLCLEFMRYRAEKEAEQRTSKITAKEVPQA